MSSVNYTQTQPALYVRPHRHETWLKVAFALAQQGTCVRRGVGAVILDEHGQVMSTGWNGVASGDVHCIDKPCNGAQAASGASLGECQAIHAEENALQQCKDVWQARTMYLTASPCGDRCLRKIKNSGIMTIVFAYGYHDPDNKLQREWEESKPGRQWIQIDVPEHTWVPLVMRPTDMQDGMYYTDDPDMAMVQVSGTQIYKGNAVQEFNHPVMCQRIAPPTFERRLVGEQAARAAKALAPVKITAEIAEAYVAAKKNQCLSAERQAELQREADSRPRVFNAARDAAQDSKVLVPTGVDPRNGLRVRTPLSMTVSVPVQDPTVEAIPGEGQIVNPTPTHEEEVQAELSATIEATTTDFSVPDRHATSHIVDQFLTAKEQSLLGNFVREDCTKHPDNAEWIKTSEGNFVTSWPNAAGTVQLFEAPAQFDGKAQLIKIFGPHPQMWQSLPVADRKQLADLALSLAQAFALDPRAELLVMPQDVFAEILDNRAQAALATLAPSEPEVPEGRHPSDTSIVLNQALANWPTFTLSANGCVMFVVRVALGSTGVVTEDVPVQGPTISAWQSMSNEDKLKVMVKVDKLARNSFVERQVVAPEHPAAANG